jgi:hypothetical protein
LNIPLVYVIATTFVVKVNRSIAIDSASFKSKAKRPTDPGRPAAVTMQCARWLLWTALLVSPTYGWSLRVQQRIPRTNSLSPMYTSSTSLPAVVPQSRRALGKAVIAASCAVLTTSAGTFPGVPPASAASSITAGVITPEEIARIQTGWEQINYLLDHFEEETTVCRENGGECKRDANAIRKVLGLRSTTDPLFQIDKVFTKFKLLQIDDYDQLDALYDAAENWNSSISMSNSMAFISQFGEYNPGGGKDEVLKYLLEAKKQVLLARDALKTIMTNLDIPMTAKSS